MPKIVKSRPIIKSLSKMKKRSIPLLFFTFCTLFSCQEPTPPEIKIDNEAIATFIKFIDYSVQEVRRLPSTDVNSATEAVIRIIPEFEKEYGVDLRYQARGFSAGRAPATSLSERDLEEKLVYYSSISESEDDYLRKLRALRTEVMNSTLSPAIKSKLLTRIALQEEVVKYLDKVDQTTRSEKDKDDKKEECSGWWKCWGKCVAGILGGAATGALTFGFAGAAVGTVTVPVVGTVSAGTVGAIAGGVAGALTGATTSCD